MTRLVPLDAAEVVLGLGIDHPEQPHWHRSGPCTCANAPGHPHNRHLPRLAQSSVGDRARILALQRSLTPPTNSSAATETAAPRRKRRGLRPSFCAWVISWSLSLGGFRDFYATGMRHTPTSLARVAPRQPRLVCYTLFTTGFRGYRKRPMAGRETCTNALRERLGFPNQQQRTQGGFKLPSRNPSGNQPLRSGGCAACTSARTEHQGSTLSPWASA